LNHSALLKGTASATPQVLYLQSGFTGMRKNSVLLKGTGSPVPQAPHLQSGFSRWGTLSIEKANFSAASLAAGSTVSHCAATFQQAPD
jgi:hypothetical protein